MVTSRSDQRFRNCSDPLPSRALDGTREGAARNGELATACHYSGLYLCHFPDYWPRVPNIADYVLSPVPAFGERIVGEPVGEGEGGVMAKGTPKVK